MKPRQLLIMMALCLMVLAAFVIVVQQTPRISDREDRAFDVIQDAARGAKQAHEREMAAQQEGLVSQPLP